MANYYEILGVDPGADGLEIKAAFRRLAMTYHPDKNPEGRDYFALILKAYETLSDPSLRSTYDYRLQYNLPNIERPKSGEKNWRFDEKEMKRRKYYDEHIKKYAKTAGQGGAGSITQKSGYNEFKYILFATPLAVGLFLMVIKITTPERSFRKGESAMVVKNAEIPDAQNTIVQPENGDALYSGHFGSGRFDPVQDKHLTIKNLTGNDVIVCLFTKTGFVRSFYVKADFSAEVSQLPGDPLHIRYSSGVGFDKTFVLKESSVPGGFTQKACFFKSLEPTSLDPLSELTLLPGTNEGFEPSNEKDFFKKLD